MGLLKKAIKAAKKAAGLHTKVAGKIAGGAVKVVKKSVSAQADVAKQVAAASQKSVQAVGGAAVALSQEGLQSVTNAASELWDEALWPAVKGLGQALGIIPATYDFPAFLYSAPPTLPLDTIEETGAGPTLNDDSFELLVPVILAAAGVLFVTILFTRGRRP